MTGPGKAPNRYLLYPAPFPMQLIMQNSSLSHPIILAKKQCLYINSLTVATLSDQNILYINSLTVGDIAKIGTKCGVQILVHTLEDAASRLKSVDIELQCCKIISAEVVQAGAVNLYSSDSIYYQVHFWLAESTSLQPRFIMTVSQKLHFGSLLIWCNRRTAFSANTIVKWNLYLIVSFLFTLPFPSAKMVELTYIT